MDTFIRPVLFTSLVVLSSLAWIRTGSKELPVLSIASDGNGVAVVELFTSEGCSSCPPADEALMDLVDRTHRDGRKVFALSFHVDYWNRLGWQDPFSSGEWSARQRRYSALTGDDVYTPQCVVNGIRSFVGSDRNALDQAVNAALASAAQVRVVADIHGQNVNYTITGNPEGCELNIAVVESSLASDVKAGENKGRHLAHTHVVRSLRTIPLNGSNPSGSIALDTSKVVDKTKAQVILFVQKKDQGAVLGASSTLAVG